MSGFDLDNPLAVDDCLRCGFVGFDCICASRRPGWQPTGAEIERARQQRLTRAEHGKGIAP